MSGIGLRRHQQAMFEMAASANRVAGSGGGSGLGLHLEGRAFNTALGQVINAAGWTTVTGSSTTIAPPVPRAFIVLVSASVSWNNGVNPLLLSIFVDTVQEQNNGSGPFAAGTFVTCPMFFVTDVLPPGPHTINIQGNPQGGSYNISNFDLYVFAMS